jgi:hypothetical protein
MWCLHISGNCRPSDTVSQQRRLQLSCTPGGTVSQQRRLQLSSTPGGTVSQQRRLQSNCTPGHTAKRTWSLMSSNVQTQDVEVRSIITYLTFVCSINFINAHKQPTDMPQALYIAHLFWSFSDTFWPLSHYEDDTYKHTSYYSSFTGLLQYICR